MSAKQGYQWILVSDQLNGNTGERAVKICERGFAQQVRVETVVSRGRQFRLRNPRGEVCYTGYIVGEFQGPEPLEDYGRDVGCVGIDYERDGLWFAVVAG